MARMFGKAHVQSGEESNTGIFDVRRDDVWMVFPNVEHERAGIVGPSPVVIVCKRTGRVIYEGPANDEG